MPSDNVQAFREAYRQSEISTAYSGAAHFVFTFGVGLSVIVGCALQLDQPTALEWLAIPMTFVYANLAEYWGHRGPMHHPTRGLRLVFRRHTRQHHRFFTDEEMAFDSSRDFKAVLFPPVMIAFFLIVFALPYWALLAWLWSANAAWLGAATAVAYFLNYEILHFAYHCRPDSLLGRLPPIPALRRLHHTHHDPSLMSHRNFNITYPIGDLLFGTLHRRRSSGS